MNAVVRRSVGVNLATKWLMSDFTEARDEAYVEGYKVGSGHLGTLTGQAINLREEEKEKIRQQAFRECLEIIMERLEKYGDEPMSAKLVRFEVQSLLSNLDKVFTVKN